MEGDMHRQTGSRQGGVLHTKGTAQAVQQTCRHGYQRMQPLCCHEQFLVHRVCTHCGTAGSKAKWVCMEHINRPGSGMVNWKRPYLGLLQKSWAAWSEGSADPEGQPKPGHYHQQQPQQQP